MKINKLLILLTLLNLIVSCNNKSEIPIEIPSKEKTQVDKNEKMEAVYYSIPSPMETTIILKKNYPKFSSDFLFPEINIHELLGEIIEDTPTSILNSSTKILSEKLHPLISVTVT